MSWKIHCRELHSLLIWFNEFMGYHEFLVLWLISSKSLGFTCIHSSISCFEHLYRFFLEKEIWITNRVSRIDMYKYCCKLLYYFSNVESSSSRIRVSLISFFPLVVMQIACPWAERSTPTLVWSTLASVGLSSRTNIFSCGSFCQGPILGFELDFCGFE